MAAILEMNNNPNVAISGMDIVTGQEKEKNNIKVFVQSRNTTVQQNKHHFRITNACVVNDHRVNGRIIRENHHNTENQLLYIGVIAIQSVMEQK